MIEKQILTPKQRDKLIDHLRGTCQGMSAALSQLFDLDEDDLTMEDTNYIDNEIFCCIRCEWWFNQDEIADSDEYPEVGDDWICTECAKEA